MQIYIYTYIHMYIHTYTYPYLHIYTSTHIHIYTYTYIIYTYNIYIYNIYIYIIYTYKHTYIYIYLSYMIHIIYTRYFGEWIPPSLQLLRLQGIGEMHLLTEMRMVFSWEIHGEFTKRNGW